MRVIDGYLSRKAQRFVSKDAIVTYDGETRGDYQLLRPDAEPLGLGDHHHHAVQAIDALAQANRGGAIEGRGSERRAEP
jgi:hypothetical protein